MPKALIIGATSSFGVELARKLAAQKWQLIISDYDEEELTLLKKDLDIRYQTRTQVIEANLNEITFHPEDLVEEAGDFDTMFLVIGSGFSSEGSAKDIADVIKINFSAPAQIIQLATKQMQQKGRGQIVVISYIVNDPDKYIYKSTTRGLLSFIRGLRYKLAGSDISILSVRCRVVDDLIDFYHTPFWSKHKTIVEQVIAYVGGKSKSIFLPWYYRFVDLYNTLVRFR